MTESIFTMTVATTATPNCGQIGELVCKKCCRNDKDGLKIKNGANLQSLCRNGRAVIFEPSVP